MQSQAEIPLASGEKCETNKSIAWDILPLLGTFYISQTQKEVAAILD